MDGLSVGGATIPQPLTGILADVRNPKGCTVTRKEAKTSMRLRKNGVLPYQAAVWCAETVGDRVRAILEVTQLDGVFQSFASAAEAVASFEG